MEPIDDIKAECIFNEQVHVKEEDNIKEEPEWEDNAGLHDISAAAARAGLYANHEVKDELVLGPVGVQPADIAFTLYACQESATRAQPVLRDCVARPETHVANNADVGNQVHIGYRGLGIRNSTTYDAPILRNQVHSNANIHTENEAFVCYICNKRFALNPQLMEHVMIHIQQEREQEEIRVVDNAARAPNARERPALRDCAVRLERLEVDLEAGRDERLASRAGRDTDVEKKIHGNIDVSTEEETYIYTCKKRFPLKSQLVDHVVSHIQRPESRRGAGSARGGRREGREPARGGRGEGREPAWGGRGEGREPTRAQDCRHACLICYKDFPTPSQLKRHERIHTGERPFSCGICKKKFTQLSNLKSHEIIHTREKPFSCGICKNKFTQLRNLKNHERIHTGESLFSCGICKKKFTKLRNFKNHERIHTGEKPFSCGICPQKFTESGSLKRHERTHTGEKPYSCGICQQKFTETGTLKSHERTHTGQRPFSCGICKRKFTQLTNLKSHERIHTGQRPFSCAICQNNFTESGHLKRHERTHTGEKPFACDVCKKQFMELSNLKRHKDRIHADWKPFCCDICQKRFTQKATLVGHIRRHRAAKPRQRTDDLL